MKQKKKFISAEKITYSYPRYNDEDEYSGRQKTQPSDDKKPEQAPALSDVDLQVEEGQFICILGGNGSGKSTLARHLNALLVPDEGTVWIEGNSTANENFLWDIRAKIGMIFQNPDNQMIASRVDEEVAFGLENIGVPSAQIVQDVQEALRIVGMEEYSKENPVNLSGGQKQRIAAAGILAMKPRCIVMDESTSMLDPEGRREIMDTVLRLHKEQGLTLICITHFMEEAIDADRIFVMHEGKILLSGTPGEIFSEETVIRQAGLRLPMICQLAGKLREKGLDIPKGILTAGQLKHCLQSLI